MLIGDTTKVELGFGNVGFGGEGKTRVPGEKPLEARMRTNNKLNPHMTASPGMEPYMYMYAIPPPQLFSDCSLTVSKQNESFVNPVIA